MHWLPITLLSALSALFPSLALAELPMGAEAARARGQELPLPFGITWQYLDQDQPLKVSKSEFSSGGNPVPARIDKLDNEDQTHTLRLDAWLWPFLNVYAVAGKSDSRASGTVTIPAGVFGPDEMQVPFRQDYDGDILGLGFTLAAAHRSLVATLDANYTETDIDISSDDATALVISPRFGWTGEWLAWRGMLWVGAMYQDLEQTLQVNTEFMGFPASATVEEEAEEPWNALVGGSWNFNPRIWLALEGGFGKREQWLGTLGYRF